MKEYLVDVLVESRRIIRHVIEAESEEEAKEIVYDIPDNEGCEIWSDNSFWEIHNIEEKN